MRFRHIITASTLIFLTAVSGCKEETPEVASPNCSNSSTAVDPSKCPRQEGNIVRSKPKNWSMDSEK